MAEHEEITFDHELRRAIEREPFLPFVIKLSSGDYYEIVDPGLLALGVNVVTYMHPKRGESFFRKNQMVAVDIPASADHE